MIFDELHKYRHWKNYLKGVYDEHVDAFRFLVLGSGRLDVYQRGGDSLAGRYLPLHIWPLTLHELLHRDLTLESFEAFFRDPYAAFAKIRPKKRDAWDAMLELTGFPEPFFSGRKATYRRWSANYRQRLIREDIRDASNVQNIEQVAAVFELLPARVGSPLPFDNLARDVQVSPASIKRWLELFDSLYLSFRLSPWARKVSRALTKEKKLYLFDYATIEELGPRFENMVALELTRALNVWNDLGHGEMRLFYLRNKDKQEVDFLITDRQKPRLLVEAKFSEETPSSSLRKFQNVFSVPALQIIHTKNVLREFKNGNASILTLSADRAFAGLP